jgi:rSAM/selenodomain-associated transferase 2
LFFFVKTAKNMTISIILPILNEQKNLLTCLQALQVARSQGHEVIVVDGGSIDDSYHLAYDWSDVVLRQSGGRGAQLDAGARMAKGDILLFLHADTYLPDNAFVLIQNALKVKTWGRFNVRLSGKRWAFRVIEKCINWRSCWSGIATGDQAMYVRREAYQRSGGFPAIVLMEDIALSRALRRQQAPVCLKETVCTSSRRWEQHGITKTILLMWTLRFAYFVGISPNQLKTWYQHYR